MAYKVRFKGQLMRYKKDHFVFTDGKPSTWFASKAAARQAIIKDIAWIQDTFGYDMRLKFYEIEKHS